ncbi:MAG: hypothetical protein MZV64_13925 [Ignavibacteriales bacterium]|nr:hypothetical protein [Ignavibacteriales bacterium]
MRHHHRLEPRPGPRQRHGARRGRLPRDAVRPAAPAGWRRRRREVGARAAATRRASSPSQADVATAEGRGGADRPDASRGSAASTSW